MLKKHKEKRFGKNKIFIKDWLEFKPYKIGKKYDSYYVKMANRVLELLEGEKAVFDRWESDKKSNRVLACVLTNYFEDFINDIGVWRVFTKKNEELYGAPLPFYRLSDDYDVDYINPEDFTFLIWYFVTIELEQDCGPYHFVLIDLGNKLYDLFEPEIDNAPTTTFYEKYFDIKEDIGFYDFHEKLLFIGGESYLTKVFFAYKLKLLLQVAMEGMPELLDYSLGIEMMFSDFMDNHLVNGKTNFSAISAGEWIAGINGVDHSIIDFVSELRMFSGLFFVESQNDLEYQVRYLLNNKVYRVLTELENKLKVDSVFELKLVFWNKKWYVLGPIFESNFDLEEVTKIERKKIESEYPTYNLSFSSEKFEEIKEMADRLYTMFLDFFKKDIVFFDTPIQLLENIEAFRQSYKEQYGLEAETDFKQYINYIKQSFNIGGQKNIPKATQYGVALFFIEGVGFFESFELVNLCQEECIAYFKYLLEKEELDDKEEIDLYLITVNLNSKISAKMLAEYPMKNIKYPVKDSVVDVFDELDFLQRFHNYMDFENHKLQLTGNMEEFRI